MEVLIYLRDKTQQLPVSSIPAASPISNRRAHRSRARQPPTSAALSLLPLTVPASLLSSARLPRRAVIDGRGADDRLASRRAAPPCRAAPHRQCLCRRRSDSVRPLVPFTRARTRSGSTPTHGGSVGSPSAPCTVRSPQTASLSGVRRLARPSHAAPRCPRPASLAGESTSHTLGQTLPSYPHGYVVELDDDCTVRRDVDAKGGCMLVRLELVQVTVVVSRMALDGKRHVVVYA